AKKALLEDNRSEELGNMEEEILELCNNLGFGPAGLGGKISVLDVHMLSTGCHIATMPVSVNIQCHAARKATGEM
ncbi:MAG TPA: fumarate hydratase, partial [Caldisericia bacterium]|nr:fumarate hydratase [Caldisericia bacterium]